ncbi:hypothetical protein RDI58_029351 [Solanum bulbocastanum]|uniref:DUF1985 domain-containing protein n=1 Tax=Solanum bulbocastanum TaxID=147425 RepID=A0AAN8SU49_SOLBU
MFRQPCFGMYLGIPECTFQAQMHRCLMTLEQENPDEFWITGLKCTDNEVDFQSYVNSSKWLLVDYFHGNTNIKKEHFIKCFYDKMWGNNNEDVVKISILYFIHNFIFSHQNDASIPTRDFEIVDSGTYDQFPWGKLIFKELMKLYMHKINYFQKLYRFLGTLSKYGFMNAACNSHPH